MTETPKAGDQCVCPHCGHAEVEKITERTTMGKRLFWGGLACTVLAGIGLPFALVGYCLTRERTKCKFCGWVWD